MCKKATMRETRASWMVAKMRSRKYGTKRLLFVGILDVLVLGYDT